MYALVPFQGSLALSCPWQRIGRLRNEPRWTVDSDKKVILARYCYSRGFFTMCQIISIHTSFFFSFCLNTKTGLPAAIGGLESGVTAARYDVWHSSICQVYIVVCRCQRWNVAGRGGARLSLRGAGEEDRRKIFPKTGGLCGGPSSSFVRARVRASVMFREKANTQATKKEPGGPALPVQPGN